MVKRNGLTTCPKHLFIIPPFGFLFYLISSYALIRTQAHAFVIQSSFIVIFFFHFSFSLGNRTYESHNMRRVRSESREKSFSSYLVIDPRSLILSWLFIYSKGFFLKGKNYVIHFFCLFFSSLFLHRSSTMPWWCYFEVVQTMNFERHVTSVQIWFHVMRSF